MKIVRLTAENVKRINVVEITPDGNLVVIGGRNGQGKTSTIDSIWYALGGKGALPGEPLKRGKKKGGVKLDLGDITVSRTFTSRGGGVLKVTGSSGKTYPSPQTLLDDLMGRLSFDPLEFSRMKPRDQLDTLKEITGVDFSELDEERRDVYTERTVANRDLKRIESKMESIDTDAIRDVPDEEVSTESIVEEISGASDINKRNEKIRGQYKDRRDIAVSLMGDMDDLEVEIRDLKVRLKDTKDKFEKAKDASRKLKDEVGKLEDVDVSELHEKLADAVELNRRIRKRQDHRDLVKEFGKAAARSEKLTERIGEIDNLKEELIEKANMPLNGLGFGDGVVLFNDIPFDQASGAEKLRVSVAIGMALNPKLQVLLIRDGSLLDKDSMVLLADMAKEGDTQIWIERVGDGDEVTVIIENGEVLEVEESNG